MKIRIADKNDAVSIAKIIKDHAQTDYMGYATFDEKYIIDKMKRDLFLVAEDIGIAGCIRISLVEIDLAEIRTLCVYEKYRSTGIASELLKKSIEIMKERKMRKIVARCKSDNSIALSLFKKFGFEQEGYFKEHYRKGIDIVQMSKFL